MKRSSVYNAHRVYIIIGPEEWFAPLGGILNGPTRMILLNCRTVDGVCSERTRNYLFACFLEEAGSGGGIGQPQRLCLCVRNVLTYRLMRVRGHSETGRRSFHVNQKSYGMVVV